MSDQPELVRVLSPNGTVVHIEAELAEQLGYGPAETGETGDGQGEDPEPPKTRRTTK